MLLVLCILPVQNRCETLLAMNFRESYLFHVKFNKNNLLMLSV